MIYIKKFMKFAAIFTIILGFITLNHILIEWFDGNLTYIFAYIIAILFVIVVIDVQIDRYLAYSKKKIMEQFEKEVKILLQETEDAIVAAREKVKKGKTDE